VIGQETLWMLVFIAVLLCLKMLFSLENGLLLKEKVEPHIKRIRMLYTSETYIKRSVNFAHKTTISFT